MDSIDSIINKRLLDMGFGLLSNQKDIVIKTLREIETIFIDSQRKRKYLMDEYKSLKINILSISSCTNISRQTFYDNHVLKEYVKVIQKEQELNDILKKVDHLESKIGDLNDRINKLMIRDVNFEMLSIENKNMINIIMDKDKTIKELYKTIEEHKKISDDLRKRLPKDYNVSYINK